MDKSHIIDGIISDLEQLPYEELKECRWGISHRKDIQILISEKCYSEKILDEIVSKFQQDHTYEAAMAAVMKLTWDRTDEKG